MSTENKMSKLSVNKLIIQMSLPPLFSMFLQYSYNFIDSIFIAKLGEDALAAVSLSFPITTLMNSLSVWIGVGVNVMIAGYLGKKENSKANSTVTLGLLLSFLIGTLVNIIILLTTKPYYEAFTNNAAILEYGLEYMSICAFMQVPNMVHISIQKMLQATGNMLAPMWFQTAGVIFNFVFDPLLIFGIGPFPKMGISGAALATVLGFTLSMVIALIMLLFTKQDVKFTIKDFHFDFKMVGTVFAYGLPSFIMNALGAFMVTFVNIFLVTSSDLAVAFFGAYFKVQQLIVMTVNGLIQGCLPIMRFNYAAKNQERLKQTFYKGTIITAIMMILGMIIIFAFPKEILNLFSASDEMLSFGIPAVRIMSLGFLFNGLSTMIATYAQATEKVFQSIVIQILRQGVLLFFNMWLLNNIFGMTGIWLSFPITESLVFFIALFIIMGKKEVRSY